MQDFQQDGAKPARAGFAAGRSAGAGLATLVGLRVARGQVLMRAQIGPRTPEALDTAAISVRRVANDKVCLGGGDLHGATAPPVRDPL